MKFDWTSRRNRVAMVALAVMVLGTIGGFLCWPLMIPAMFGLLWTFLDAATFGPYDEVNR